MHSLKQHVALPLEARGHAVHTFLPLDARSCAASQPLLWSRLQASRK